MTSTVFPDVARAAFAQLYPEQPGLLTHSLVGHPLLQFDALVALAQRMRPVDVEQNIGALPIGIDPADVAHNGLSAAETIRSIDRNQSWMVLKFIEQDPEYRALLAAILAEIAPLAAKRTGAMLKLEGFIFVSSPGSVTPFHFDPEHNILLQLQGSKVMTVFPAGDTAIVDATLHEAFHLGGHRNLPFSEAFAEKGRAFALAPGDAIHVPVKAPHWVKNGDAPSISLSVTWRSEWSYQEADAHGLNHWLRRFGARPAMPHRYPRHNRAKSIAWRGLGKVKRILGMAKAP